MSAVEYQTDIERIAERLRSARRVLFITGAGISADSGLPTYRGVGGLYDQGGTEDGVPIETALSESMFRVHPETTWKYIRQIEAACRDARCNRGHAVIAEMERTLESVWVLTQNVDGLHRQAGSRNVIDIHGDIHELVCTGCGLRETVGSFAELAALPLCRECGAVIRPNVVLFGERLPSGKLRTLEEQLAAGFEIVFSVGTTSAFPYVAHPVLEAVRSGVPTVEINPGETAVTRVVEFKLRMGAAEACDRIWQAYGRPARMAVEG